MARDHGGAPGAQLGMAPGGADAGMVVPAAGALGGLVHLHLDGQAGEGLSLIALAGAVDNLHPADDEQGLEVVALQLLEPLPGAVIQVQGELGVGGLLDGLGGPDLPPGPC